MLNIKQKGFNISFNMLWLVSVLT